DEMRLVENDTGPWDAMKTLGILGEDIVVHDHPARIELLPIRNSQHLDPGVRIHHPDLSPPVELERGGAADENHPGRGGDLHPDDRLPGLAQAHVVAEDRPPLGDQKSNTVRLVRIEQSRRNRAECVEMGDWKLSHAAFPQLTWRTDGMRAPRARWTFPARG